MNKPRITAVIANYNNAPYIRECFESIIKQTLPPTSIVIVDDCSTDTSWDVIQQIKKEHSYVFIHQNQENKGVSFTRNIGMKTFWDGSDAFLVVDSDDVMYKDKIQKSVDIMFNYPNISVVYSDYDTYNENTKTLIREYKYPFTVERLTKNCIVCGNSLLSKGFLEKVGLYDESFRVCEDYDLWIRMSQNSVLYHLPESLFMYRVKNNSLTSNYETNPIWKESLDRLMKKHSPKPENTDGNTRS